MALRTKVDQKLKSALAKRILQIFPPSPTILADNDIAEKNM